MSGRSILLGHGSLLSDDQLLRFAVLSDDQLLRPCCAPPEHSLDAPKSRSHFPIHAALFVC